MADHQDGALNSGAHALIADPANQVFVSAASVWEIAIKRHAGKLDFSGSAVAAIDANGFLEMPGALPWVHTDPFDRMLVVQAMRLALTLATADSAIRSYAGVPQVWVR